MIPGGTAAATEMKQKSQSIKLGLLSLACSFYSIRLELLCNDLTQRVKPVN